MTLEARIHPRQLRLETSSHLPIALPLLPYDQPGYPAGGGQRLP